MNKTKVPQRWHDICHGSAKLLELIGEEENSNSNLSLYHALAFLESVANEFRPRDEDVIDKSENGLHDIAVMSLASSVAYALRSGANEKLTIESHGQTSTQH